MFKTCGKDVSNYANEVQKVHISLYFWYYADRAWNILYHFPGFSFSD